MSLSEVLLAYIRAILSYWWVIVAGIVMPCADLFKWHHKSSKELVIPYWARLMITVIAVIAAQFFAFRDAQHNLSVVIGEKGTLTGENIQLRTKVAELEQQAKDLKERIPAKNTADVSLLRYMKRVTSVVADADGKFDLPEFDFKNIGAHSTTAPISLRLYFSDRVVYTGAGSWGQWQPMPSSNEPGMPTEFWIGGQYTISPGESWHGPSFSGVKQGGVIRPIQVRLKVFYGVDRPAEANLTIMPPPGKK